RAGPVPDLDGAVAAAPGEPSPVTAERHALHRTGRVVHVVQELPAAGVPDLHGTVPAARGQQLPVPAERHTGDPGCVPRLENTRLLAGRPVPDPDSAVRAPGGEVPAVGGTERHPVDRPAVV